MRSSGERNFNMHMSGTYRSRLQNLHGLKRKGRAKTMYVRCIRLDISLYMAMGTQRELAALLMSPTAFQSREYQRVAHRTSDRRLGFEHTVAFSQEFADI